MLLTRAIKNFAWRENLENAWTHDCTFLERANVLVDSSPRLGGPEASKEQMRWPNGPKTC
eukprot:604167-Pyramimonas_sp.AAC.1